MFFFLNVHYINTDIVAPQPLLSYYSSFSFCLFFFYHQLVFFVSIHIISGLQVYDQLYSDITKQPHDLLGPFLFLYFFSLGLVWPRNQGFLYSSVLRQLQSIYIINSIMFNFLECRPSQMFTDLNKILQNIILNNLAISEMPHPASIDIVYAMKVRGFSTAIFNMVSHGQAMLSCKNQEHLNVLQKLYFKWISEL